MCVQSLCLVACCVRLHVGVFQREKHKYSNSVIANAKWFYIYHMFSQIMILCVVSVATNKLIGDVSTTFMVKSGTKLYKQLSCCPDCLCR